MLDRLFGSHIDHLGSALDRTTRRQSLLMANMANANVPGYKRRDIDFHVALEEKMGAGRGVTGASAALDGETSDDVEIRVDGSSVDVEQEVVSIAETALHFRAVTDLTAGYFSGLKKVIREGR